MTRALGNGAQGPRAMSRVAGPLGEASPGEPPSDVADESVEVVALYAEMTVVETPSTPPERPHITPVEQTRPPMAHPMAHPAASLPGQEYMGDDVPTTGVMPVVRPPRPERTSRERERYVHVPGTVDVRGDVGPLIDELHAIFERDRAVASQGSTARCGVCYFHFPIGDLVYRDAEGFYVCPDCERALGGTRIVMVRRQQRG